MRATIITIGDELLFGQVVDTNATWLSAQLSAAGYTVVERMTVGDVEAHIFAAFGRAWAQSELVVTTGGLGPTNDDKTKPCVAAFFGDTLVEHPVALEHVQELFASRGRTMNERTRAQALLPTKAIYLQNKWGTAPPLILQEGKRFFVSLPGVPREMKPLLTEQLLPFLAHYHTMPATAHGWLIAVGIMESALAERIAEWESALPKHMRLAYLPAEGVVRLRLSVSGNDTAESLQAQAEAMLDEIVPLLGNHVVARKDYTMEQALAEKLTARGWTLALAESCTGGYMAHRHTVIAGSSAWFEGGVVAYSNELKGKLLNVKEETLLAHGAVSELTATEMVNGLAHIKSTECAIAVSGVAGPSGGTPQKPVGTVWVATKVGDKVLAKQYQFTNDRELNIKLTANYAQWQLFQMLG